LSEELVGVIRIANKDSISLLKENRTLDTNSFLLKDVAGKPIAFHNATIQAKDFVSLIPPNAYRPVTIDGQT